MKRLNFIVSLIVAAIAPFTLLKSVSNRRRLLTSVADGSTNWYPHDAEKFDIAEVTAALAACCKPIRIVYD